MGEIKRQSYWNTINAYIGVALGYLNMGIIMPKILPEEEVGLIQLLISVSLVFSTVFRWGLPYVVIKYFPFYRSKEQNHYGFWSLLQLCLLFGGVLFLGFLLAGEQHIKEYYQQESPLFAQYYWVLIPFVVGMMIYDVWSAYARSFYKSVVPNFIREVGLRIFMLLDIILFYTEVIDFATFTWLFAGAFLLVGLFTGGYIWYLGEARLTKPTIRAPVKEVINFSLYALMGGASMILVQSIDKIMIAGQLGLLETGVYSIAFLFGTVIQVPFRSMILILEPILAEVVKNNDREKLRELYMKSSLNLHITGLLFFILVYANVDSVFSFLPEAYMGGKYVVLFIGLAKIFDMLTGVNAYIILNATYFRFDLVANVLLVALTVITNAILIPLYGINGAALATLVSLSSVNLFRCIIIWYKSRVHPLSIGLLHATIVGVIVFAVGVYLPRFNIILFDIAYRSIIIGTLFGGTVLFMRISPQINDFIKGKLPTALGRWIP